jgi:malate synthase
MANSIAYSQIPKNITTPLFPEELSKLLVRMHTKFQSKRLELLAAREERQRLYDAGEVPSFLDQNSPAVSGEWQVFPIPKELMCRRVEITGPVNSAKMVINMLSSNESGIRADMAMLDFEDSMKPTWPNVLEGFVNVIGAAKRNLVLITPQKTYALNPNDMAYPMVRVRGLHLSETNTRVSGTAMSAGLFDLTVCFFHTAKIYLEQKRTPKFYIPKCEHHLEARWWNEVFSELERSLDVPEGTLRCTFLIETLPATFQIEEILFETKNHIVGLNVGRWDKIFSDIKTLKNHPNRVLADRAAITMNVPWMENYAKRVIHLCHKRGAFAMGGMAAFTPGKDAELRAEQTKKVTTDKEREFAWGHDGCWVSHPYFIGPALAAFPKENQLSKKLPEFNLVCDLLPRGEGPKTLNGLRTNIRVGIAYMQGWNDDIGCVSWDNLMEDLATLEISRAQVWQWLHHKIKLDSGEIVTRQLVQNLFHEELIKITAEVGSDPKILSSFKGAQIDAEKIFTNETLSPFLSVESNPYQP